MGDRGTGGEAETLEAIEEIGAERILPTHEMGAARDVEEEAISTVDADPGRVAMAPIGQGRERFGIGRGICGKARKARQDRLRVGERQAGADAGFLGEMIRRADDEPAALGQGRDEGLRAPYGPRPRDPLGRESRQPQ